MAFFMSLFGLEAGAAPADPAVVISAPISRDYEPTALDKVIKDVIQLSKDVSSAAPRELETKYSDLLSLKQKRESLVQEDEDDWVIALSEAEESSLAFIDDKLGKIQTKFSGTQAHKKHVLAKLTKLKSAILARPKCDDISEEGTFRLSGSKPKVDALAERLETDLKTDLSQEMKDTLIGMFKKMVKELGGSETFLLDEIQGQLLKLLDADTIDIGRLKKEVEVLTIGSPEYEITKLVIGLLAEVAKYCATNKMPASNLATCMVPNLFSDFLPQTPIVKAMIEHYETIFPS